MKKVKILFGLEAAGGGALKHLVYLVSHLNRDIFNITVILSDKRNNDIAEEINKMKQVGAKVTILPMKRGFNPINDIISFIKIYLLIRKTNFDIVHGHSSKAGALLRLAAYFNHVPSVLYTPHCFYFQGQNGIKKNVYIFL